MLGNLVWRVICVRIIDNLQDRRLRADMKTSGAWNVFAMQIILLIRLHIYMRWMYVATAT